MRCDISQGQKFRVRPKDRHCEPT